MMRHKDAFTLLEILVVIVIIEVLAAVAVPSLFRNIERSRAAEALHTIGVIRRQINVCVWQFRRPNFNGCDSFDLIGMADPSYSSGNPSSHFDYTLERSGQLIYVRATRVSLEGGTPGDQIYMWWPSEFFSNVAPKISGTSAFAGITD